MGSIRGRRAFRLIAAVALVLLVASACIPEHPSAGRSTPVRRVLVLGDSISYGLFGTSPRIHDPLGQMLADRGVSLRVTGFPAENPAFSWPGHLPWLLRMTHEVETWNPDVIVIQSILFADADEPGRIDAYRTAIAQLMDVARSRDAHVYIVKHHGVPGTTEARHRDVAEALQAEAASSRGISTIPLDWWMQRCEAGTSTDGVHLTHAGQRCHALAVTFAVDQLRDAVG